MPMTLDTIERITYKLITIENAIAGVNHEDTVELFAIQEQVKGVRKTMQLKLDEIQSSN